MYKDKHGDVYVTLVLALYAATYLNTKLHYNILIHYIETKPKQQAEEIEMLRNRLLLAEQNITTSNTLKWVSFQISYAYYIIVIDNIVKCSAVGLKDQENIGNLDVHLSGHRNTHAPFVLVNVIQFKDSASVTLFEN